MIIAQIISNPCPDWVPAWWCFISVQSVTPIVVVGVLVAAVAKLRGWRSL